MKPPEKPSQEENYQQRNSQQRNSQQGNYQQRNSQQRNSQQGNYQRGNSQQRNSQRGNYQRGNYQRENYQQRNYQQRDFRQQNNQPPQYSGPATAPYNFVSLPAKVLPAPIDTPKDFADYMASHENLSGEISLDIEALTPLFIGGNGTKAFAPVDKPIIPGSSLRGMFKNIFKVVTCGAFRGRTDSQKKGEDFNDEHVYFRCLMTTRNSPAWMSDLNKLYNDRMIGSRRGTDGKLRPIKNARPGFLIRMADNKYFIAPSIYRTDRKEDRILIREYERKFTVTIPERNSSHVDWRGGIAYIITGSQRRDRLCEDAETYEKLTDDQKKRAGKQFIRFTKIDYVDWNRDHWVALPDDVQTSYEHDRNRRGVNLFTDKGILKRSEIERLTEKNLPDIKSLIPCHYLEEGGQVTAFGHGQCFRIPYQKKIGDAVKISGNDAIDFADLVFGKEKFWASRVYFDDATTENFKTLRQETAHPLMQPNPTSYQLYLKQSGDKLNHWDTIGAEIRGYKFYWHRDDPDWHATKAEKDLDRDKAPDKRLTKEMTPLDKGSKFAAKIRFKNLSAIELGALMMIFNLNGADNAAYKIGQGKPLGFGSVRITPKLFIESATAYSELFGADGWENPYREEKPDTYLAAFKKYLAEKNMSETWQLVMAELNKILDWSQTCRSDWNEKIKSMSGDVSRGDVDPRFKSREPLPDIFKVVGK